MFHLYIIYIYTYIMLSFQFHFFYYYHSAMQIHLKGLIHSQQSERLCLTFSIFIYIAAKKHSKMIKRRMGTFYDYKQNFLSVCFVFVLILSYCCLPVDILKIHTIDDDNDFVRLVFCSVFSFLNKIKLQQHTVDDYLSSLIIM